MFFVMGITQGRRDLEYNQLVICDQCGSYGRYKVFMTYMVLSIFFIPCLKWSKKYYVQSSCCDTIYALDGEIGRRISREEEVEIRAEDLELIQSGNPRRGKRCKHCGYETEEDFTYCPKCGQEL